MKNNLRAFMMADGIPGDLGAFKPLGRVLRLFDMGGGGQQQQQPTTQTVNNVTIPEYAKPYAENLLGQASALTDVNKNPYQPYAGQQVAGFNPLQQQAFNQIGNMQTSGQTGAASDLAASAGERAMNYGNYQPGQFNSGYSNPQYQRMGIGAQSVGYNGPQFQSMGIGYGNTNTGQFTDPNTAASYMNPYMRNVVDFQSSEAIRDYQKTLPQEQAMAVSKGAFGGNRQAINQSEMQRNLNTQLGGIAATGASNAYNAAQQAFMADQGRSLQSQQGNQQAQLAAQGQGLQQLLANNQQNVTNAQQSLQAQGMNQQAGLTAQGQGLQQNMAANQQNLTNAQNTSQYGLQAQQLGEQSRQYGAGLGLQGLQTGISAANQLGQLGQQDYTQQLGISQAQQQSGLLQQQNQQQNLNVDYQKYADQLNYPYKQLGFMQGIVQGLPISQNSQSMYQAPPTTTASLASLGIGAYGLSGLLGKKEGGVVKMAGGGLADQYRMMSTADSLTDQQLQQSQAVPPYMKDAIARNRGMLRTAMPSREEPPAGVAGLPAPNMESMADGGIVGYADGGAARYNYQGPYPRESEAEREAKEWERGLALMGAVTAPVGAPALGVAHTGYRMGQGLIHGARRYPNAVRDAAAAVGVTGLANLSVPYPSIPNMESEMAGEAAVAPVSLAEMRAKLARRNMAPPSAEEFAATQHTATPASIAAARAAAAQAGAQQPGKGPAGSRPSGVAAALQSAPAPAAAPAFEPEKALGIAELMKQRREAQDEQEARNPLYAKLKKQQDKADAMDAEIVAYKDKSPYLMALAAAEKLGQRGKGFISAATEGLGEAGRTYAAREQQADAMGIKALDAQSKMLAIEDALRRGDSSAAEKLITAAEAGRTRVEGYKARAADVDKQVGAQMYGHNVQREVGLAAAAARDRATAAHGAALGSYEKTQAQLTKILGDVNKQAQANALASLKAAGIDFMDTGKMAAAVQAEKARLLAERADEIGGLRARLGLVTGAAAAADPEYLSTLPAGAQVRQ